MKTGSSTPEVMAGSYKGRPEAPTTGVIQSWTNMRASGGMQLTAAMVLSGTIGMFVHESGLASLNVVFFRCLFGLCFLGAYSAWRGYIQLNHLNGRDLKYIAVGGAALTFNWYFLFEAFQYSGIGMTTVVYHTQPFFVLLISAVFLKERFTLRAIGWIAVAFAGIVLIARPTSGSADSDLYLLGLAYALVAAILYAIATVCAKELKHLKPHMVVVLQLSLGTILLWPMTSLETVPGVGQHWFWLLGLGIIHTCVMYVLMYSGFQKVKTETIAVLSYIYPAVALAVDYWVYDQTISSGQFMGITLILMAGFAMNNPRVQLFRARIRWMRPSRID